MIVPAYTVRPSSSFERANALASASVTNVLVSRGLRCLGRMARLRTSNVTYQIGVVCTCRSHPSDGGSAHCTAPASAGHHQQRTFTHHRGQLSRAPEFPIPIFVIGDRLTSADTINGAATIHWRPRPDRFASRSAGNRARPEHNTRPGDTSHRIADVLTVDHGTRRMTGDSDAQQT